MSTVIIQTLKFKLSQPIIVVGLPKAGTISLLGFFHCNGLCSQHCYLVWKTTRSESRRARNHGRLHVAYDLHRHATPIFKGCGDYAVCTEINGPRRTAGKIPWSHLRASIFLPQHYHLQEIHKQHPQATLILNTRPSQEWVRSVHTWGKTCWPVSLPMKYIAWRMEHSHCHKRWSTNGFDFN
jgi:hypothetical protein